jgi:deoxyribose-phosphate aldolase
VQPAATLPVTLLMLQAIVDHQDKTGVKIGMKPAGGVRNAKMALQYLCIVQETMGDDWMTPDLFRFGASALLNDVLMQLEKEQTGRYAGEDYFSKD